MKVEIKVDMNSKSKVIKITKKDSYRSLQVVN